MPRTDQRLAYETALRALDQQERLFDGIRTRAGALLAAGSLAISLFATGAANSASPPLLTVGALAAYVVSASAALIVLFPRLDAAFSCSPAAVAIWERTHDEAATYAKVVQELGKCHLTNGAASRLLIARCQIAAIALAVETILLVAELAASII